MNLHLKLEIQAIIKQNTRTGSPTEDRDWFNTHKDRQYRIRPKREDETGIGFVVIRQIYPGYRVRVGIGPEGILLADNDQILGKIFDIRYSGKSGFIFPHDGTVVSEDELKS